MSVTVTNTTAGISGDELITAADTQTLTNKTLTSPNLTSPTVTSGTLTLSGGQVAFPASQAPSAGANTLDDYEEGTWTPVIGGSGGTSGQTYSAQEGRYIKIGSVVWAAFRAVLSAKGTITTTVQIQGLPFTAETGTLTTYQGVLSWNALVTSYVSMTALVNQNATTATIFGVTAAATSNLTTSLTTADIAATSQFSGMFIYRAAN